MFKTAFQQGRRECDGGGGTHQTCLTRSAVRNLGERINPSSLPSYTAYVAGSRTTENEVGDRFSIRMVKDAQNGAPTRPQEARRLRRTLAVRRRERCDRERSWSQPSASHRRRMFKTAVQQGRRRGKTGGVPSGGTSRILISREHRWKPFSTVVEDAQNGSPTRPQEAQRLRRILVDTSQGDVRPRTKLEPVFSIRLVLADLGFRIHLLIRQPRLRVPLVVHQQIADRHDADD